MILTAGKTNVEKLLGGDAAGDKITHICVGTSNTPVTAGDTTLTDEVSVPIDSVLYPAADLAVFSATLPASTPSFTIEEMGLRNEAGTLVHRKIVTPAVGHVFGLAVTLRYQIKVV